MAKFQKGNPGGPGRPRGSRNAITIMLDRLAVEGPETVAKEIIAAALGGDHGAARLVLKRAWASPKDRAWAIALPRIKTPADLLAAHAALAEGIAVQTITLQEGVALCAKLDLRRCTFELVAPEDRVERLEAQISALEAKLQ